MTPFENAGYTKDTKFKVLEYTKNLRKGDIVTLEEDDGSWIPKFKTEDGRAYYLFLPDEDGLSILEVYEEEVPFKPNFTMSQYANKQDLYKAKAEYYEKAFLVLASRMFKLGQLKYDSVVDDYYLTDEGKWIHQLVTDEDWFNFTDDEISDMDKSALEWWNEYKDTLKNVLKDDPATPIDL